MRLWTFVAAGIAWGCASVRAGYPSWEPTSALVPVVSDRAMALADLEASRKLWLDRRPERYSYVRALQVSPDEAEFTFVAVENGAVVERALLKSFTDDRGLGDRLAGKLGQTPQLLWRERGRELGRHGTGAPALTVEQLYALCRDRVLSVRANHAPRLSFHIDGLLQHCGFLNDDCPDCPVVSMQAVAPITPQPWQAPQDLTCTDRYGLFIDGQDPLGGWPCEICRCEAANRADPRPPPPPAPASPEQLARCEESGLDCPAEPAVGDICKIDPAACPVPRGWQNRANWSCMWLLTADCRGWTIRPSPECTALPRPSSGSDPVWQRRCRPRQ